MTTSSKHNEVFTEVGPVERLPIEAISPPRRSLRKYTDQHKKQYAKCIETLGLISPVIIDSAGVIVAGLIWYHGALQLGLRELPVIRVTHLTPEQLELYRIAEQRLGELAPWDDRSVAEAFKELSQLDLGFSLEVTGFSQGEIDFRIESLESLQLEPAPDPADIVPAVVSAPVSAVNDLWQAGPHRILCQSALQSDSFSTLMAGERARAVITDPPFNLPVHGHVSGKGRIRHREFAMASGEMSNEEFTAFLSGYLRGSTEHLSPGALLYIFMDWRHCAQILAAGQAIGLELKNICAWVKSNAGMGSLYRSQHELVFVFKHGKAPHRNNVELGRHGRFRTNVWQYPGCNSFERSGEEGNLLAVHPTVKPVQLLADAILDCTERNDIVLDNFLGSGSTLLAAERVGRRLYATELEPRYVDVAIRRWQRHTGQSAVHVPTGRLFDEIAADKQRERGQ
ncbi:DNA modification methylase [Bradyrhizobium sp. IC3195]|uniref:DNA modification methylase n=1 Tax=Bradyrhizobium sp. IC3195 TaxID=2793804 RepID=UPI001CD56B98|nr:DNA modification methylase [Bradyrhizobium sp. IC3195]MCA1471259.1 DNA modification methylase [Bradyrhizobium sp. IC3195]